MARNTRTFTDLDFAFVANPVSGDVNVKTDENAIKQSVRNLILTNHYDRLFHPEIGSQITSMLFENFTQVTISTIEQAIINTITNFEPRVELQSVELKASPDNNTLYASIFFKIINTLRPIQLDLTLDRTR